jgi:hypothetical protein
LKTFCITLLFCVSGLLCLSQKRSRQEWCWAITHPVAALKVKQVSKKCYFIYNNTPSLKNELDSFSNGGKLDAFRHIFFMAAFAQKVKPKKLVRLGIAHEKANYRNFLKGKKEDREFADSLGTVMDLKNNETGILIGRGNKKAGLSDLKNLVLNEIKNGKAVIMKRRKNGMYEDCNGKLIDTALFSGKWFVPKCMVNSNYVYP